MTSAIIWKRDPRWSEAEQCLVDDHHELVAFDLAPTTHFPRRECGWEIFGPPRRRTLLATGQAASLSAAKVACEQVWREMEGRR